MQIGGKKERRRRSAGQDRCYIRKEIERKNRGSEGDPLPFHRQMQRLFIELIFRGEVRHSLKDTLPSMESKPG